MSYCFWSPMKVESASQFLVYLSGVDVLAGAFSVIVKLCIITNFRDGSFEALVTAVTFLHCEAAPGPRWLPRA